MARSRYPRERADRLGRLFGTLQLVAAFNGCEMGKTLKGLSESVMPASCIGVRTFEVSCVWHRKEKICGILSALPEGVSQDIFSRSIIT